MSKVKKIVLEPPIVVKRAKMKGKKVIKVTVDGGDIKVESKAPDNSSSPEVDEDGYSRTKVYDSWET